MAYIDYIGMFFIIFGIAIFSEGDKNYRKEEKLPPGLFILNFVASTIMSYLISLVLYDIANRLITSTSIGGMTAFFDRKEIKNIMYNVIEKVFRIKGDLGND